MLRWPRDVLYPQKLIPTSSTSGGRVSIVRSRTKATEIIIIIIPSLVLESNSDGMTHITIALTQFYGSTKEVLTNNPVISNVLLALRPCWRWKLAILFTMLLIAMRYHRYLARLITLICLVPNGIFARTSVAITRVFNLASLLLPGE
jgi:hypothetical protein